MIRIAELPGNLSRAVYRALPRGEQIGRAAPESSYNARMQPGDSLQLPFEERRILSVSNLNREARRLVETGLGVVWVEGEISNLSRPSSGHLYWSLKDSEAQVRCAMFRLAARGLGFELANGQQVLVRARASLYEARGEYQLVVEYVEEAGEGALRRKFEELKRRLAAEGLFEPARKRAIPKMPRRIGVITSPTGAALRDVLIALRRRFPLTAVLIYPTAVQGPGSAEEIARTLALADRRADCDVLILTRGGGSLEDLWSFNEEIVARAVAADRAADHRRRRPRDRLHDRGLRRRPARADAVAGGRARGAGSTRVAEALRASRAADRAVHAATHREGAAPFRDARAPRAALQPERAAARARAAPGRARGAASPLRRAAHRDAQAAARAARDGRRAREPRASADAHARALAHGARRLAPRVAAPRRAHAAALEARVART